MSIRDKTVVIDGQSIGLQDLGSDGDSNFELLMLPIRSLEKNHLVADNKQGIWEYVFAGIMGGIGLFLFVGGILLTLSGFGLFPGPETGFWNIAFPGMVSILLGGWLGLSGIGMAIGYTRLVIDPDRILLEDVVSGRGRKIAEGPSSPDNYLKCHLREDAEQDIYSVSLELVIPDWQKIITLFLMGVSVDIQNDTNKSYDKAFREGLTRSAKAAFEQANSISRAVNISIQR